MPVKNDPDGGTIAIKKIDANTFGETYSVNGKPRKLYRYTVNGNALRIASTYVEQKATSTFTAERVSTPERWRPLTGTGRFLNRLVVRLSSVP